MLVRGIADLAQTGASFHHGSGFMPGAAQPMYR